jgi:hypothetical protein
MNHHGSPIYGLIAEFREPEDLVHAAEETRNEGYTQLDAFTPFPVDGLAEALGSYGTMVPVIVFLGGLLGAIGGYFLQYYIAVIDYPNNIGGRPLHSWPAFIPVTFECTILAASLFAFFGLLFLNRLPQPYHPIFNAPRFDLASQTRFFLCVKEEDPNFDYQKTWDFLTKLKPQSISEVDY